MGKNWLDKPVEWAAGSLTAARVESRERRLRHTQPSELRARAALVEIVARMVDVWHHSFVLRVAFERRDGVPSVVNRAGLTAQVVVFQGLWR